MPMAIVSFLLLVVVCHYSKGQTCPEGVEVVTCPQNPCRRARCDNHPTAECRVNVCGTCSADFYVNGRLVDCALCPINAPEVSCLVDPCRVRICRTFPTAQCRSNMCGGCNAHFFINNRLVDCTQCPPWRRRVQCLVAPCRINTCPLRPNARCVNNFCGGCNAHFYVGTKFVPCCHVGDTFIRPAQCSRCNCTAPGEVQCRQLGICN